MSLEQTRGLPQLTVELLSKLPPQPIEPPEDWVWGEHPDKGLGYKAKNGLTLDQCVKNGHLSVTVLCQKYANQATFGQCRQNMPSRATVLCKRFCATFRTCAKIPEIK